MASLLLPLLTVVSLDASAACVGMTTAGAAGFADVVETHHEDAPADLGHPSHGLDLTHSPPGSHDHDDSQRPADSHGHGGTGESMPPHAGVLHEHGDCAHCPSSPASGLDSGHAVCTVTEGGVATAASAPAVQWDQKPFLSPIAWIVPPPAAWPARIGNASAQATAVPHTRSLQVRYCVLLL